MVPDDDRRQLAESGYAKRKPLAGIWQWQNEIVTKFVLNDEIELIERNAILLGPIDDVAGGRERGKGGR